MKQGMFGADLHTVNLKTNGESTIGFGSSRLLDTLACLPDPSRLQRLLRWVLPPRCRHCGGTVDMVAALDACRHCILALPWLPAGFDSALSTPLKPDRHSLGVQAICAPFAFQDRVAADLRGLKFAGDFAVATLYGALLAAQVARESSVEIDLPECLLPVPLHSSRLAERGFNQAAALALQVGRRLRLPVRPRLLQRRRATAAQTGLSAAERQRNLRQAFVAADDGAGIPTRIALLDDVLTTGATVGAATAALRDAGVREIQVWTVARTIPTNITNPTY